MLPSGLYVLSNLRTRPGQPIVIDDPSLDFDENRMPVDRALPGAVFAWPNQPRARIDDVRARRQWTGSDQEAATYIGLPLMLRTRNSTTLHPIFGVRSHSSEHDHQQRRSISHRLTDRALNIG